MNVFHDYFKCLNTENNDVDRDVDTDFSKLSEQNVNDTINNDFTTDEVAKVIMSLKNDKTCGLDQILNEFIKTNIKDIFLPIYVKLFNIVLQTGVVPSNWSIGIIKPIYKNKGDKKEPFNYRGISILSCLSKVFTALINQRLENLVKNSGVVGPEQAVLKNTTQP